MEKPSHHHLLEANYSQRYTHGEKHDSPELSRVSMIRRIYGVLREGLVQPTMLNIGSGPQSLEKQLRYCRNREDYDLIQHVQSVSMDIASIPLNKLLGKQYDTLQHVRADALRLPFRASSFGLVVSNHAIDFIPRHSYDDPYHESKRVLADGGTAIFYFHHPSMIPKDLSRVKNPVVLNHWSYLRDQEILFDSPDAITECLVSRVGFRSVAVSQQSDKKDTWWEVVAKK